VLVRILSRRYDSAVCNCVMRDSLRFICAFDSICFLHMIIDADASDDCGLPP